MAGSLLEVEAEISIEDELRLDIAFKQVTTCDEIILLRANEEQCKLSRETVRGDAFLIYKEVRDGTRRYRFRREEIFSLPLADLLHLDLAAFRTNTYVGCIVCVEMRSY